jgi:hypothetical protein
MKVIEYIGEVLLPNLEKVRNLFKVGQSGQKGWEVFRRLGKDAIGGKLSNASTNHDKYLYGKEKWGWLM